MTESLSVWPRETERRPFDAAAWNRLVRWMSGHLAAPLTLVDAAGSTLLVTKTSAPSLVTLAGIAAFGASTGVDITAAVDITGDTALTGNLTMVGAGRRFLADFTNATLANRTMFQTSTAGSDTNIIAIPNGAGTTGSWIAANNSTVASGQGLQLRGTTTRHRLASVDLGAGSTLPIGVYFGATQRFGFETTGDVVLNTNNVAYRVTESGGTVRDAVKLNGSNVLLLGNATSRLTVSSPLTNAAKLTGSNAANSATIDLIGTNASDQIDVGVSGTRANLLGTVVAPAIDPPTVNGQVTVGSQAAASAHVKGGGGSGSIVTDGSVALGNNYNIASVTRNLAGDYTVAVDRDFSDAFYVVQVTVVDNGAVVLVPKVNSQAAGSFDVHIWTTAGTKTDPDAFNVTCHGTLS